METENPTTFQPKSKGTPKLVTVTQPTLSEEDLEPAQRRSSFTIKDISGVISPLLPFDKIGLGARKDADKAIALVNEGKTIHVSPPTTPTHNNDQDNQEETIIVISFKLPVQIVRGKHGGFEVVPSQSILLNTLFNVQQNNLTHKTIWIGWPGVIPKDD